MKSAADYKTPILMQLSLGSAFFESERKYLLILFQGVMSKRVCHASVTLCSSPMSKHILPHALQTPAIKKLEGKRIVLASSSPRRTEILKTFVRAFLFPFRYPITPYSAAARSGFRVWHQISYPQHSKRVFRPALSRIYTNILWRLLHIRLLKFMSDLWWALELHHSPNTD